MNHGILIALLAGIILLAGAVVPPILPAVNLFGSALAEKNPKAATNLNTSRSNIARGKHRGKHIGVVKRKAGSGKGEPAGLAVSDPGSEGSKPSKGKSK